MFSEAQFLFQGKESTSNVPSCNTLRKERERSGGYHFYLKSIPFTCEMMGREHGFVSWFNVNKYELFMSRLVYEGADSLMLFSLTLLFTCKAVLYACVVAGNIHTLPMEDFFV